MKQALGKTVCSTSFIAHAILASRATPDLAPLVRGMGEAEAGTRPALQEKITVVPDEGTAGSRDPEPRRVRQRSQR